MPEYFFRPRALLVSRLRKLKPDAVFVNLGINQNGLLVKEIREQGIVAPLLSNYWIQQKEVIENAGAANLEGIIFVGLNLDKPRFRKTLRDLAGESEQPNIMHYTCYSALGVALETIKRHRGSPSAEGLASTLSSLRSIPFPDGSLVIEEREAQYDLQYRTIRSGKVEKLS